MTRLPAPDINAALPLTVEAGHRLRPREPCGDYPIHHVWDCRPAPCPFAEFPWDSRARGPMSAVEIPAHALRLGTDYVLSYRVTFADPLAHTTYSDGRELQVRPRLLPLQPHLLPSTAPVLPDTPCLVTARHSRDPSPFPNSAPTVRWAVCAHSPDGTCTPFPDDHPFAIAALLAELQDNVDLVVPPADWVGVLRVALTYAHVPSNRTSRASAYFSYTGFSANVTLRVGLEDSLGQDHRYHAKALAPLGLYPQWVQAKGRLSTRRSGACACRDAAGPV